MMILWSKQPIHIDVLFENGLNDVQFNFLQSKTFDICALMKKNH